MNIKKLYESPKKDQNEEIHGITSTSCVCCSKPTNEDYFVHMTTEWFAVEAKVTENDLAKIGMESQGLYAIGYSCAKRMGKKFIINA